MSVEVWTEYAKQGLTPHVRGFVRIGQASPLSDNACPACAGIYPSFQVRKPLTLWLPRTRGDVSSATRWFCSEG